jgi:hypothetical protein
MSTGRERLGLKGRIIQEEKRKVCRKRKAQD